MMSAIGTLQVWLLMIRDGDGQCTAREELTTDVKTSTIRCDIGSQIGYGER